jgi:hypothetical protein
MLLLVRINLWYRIVLRVVHVIYIESIEYSSYMSSLLSPNQKLSLFLLLFHSLLFAKFIVQGLIIIVECIY